MTINGFNTKIDTFVQHANGDRTVNFECVYPVTLPKSLHHPDAGPR